MKDEPTLKDQIIDMMNAAYETTLQKPTAIHLTAEDDLRLGEILKREGCSLTDGWNPGTGLKSNRASQLFGCRVVHDAPRTYVE